MKDADLVAELASRAHVQETTVRAVLGALAHVAAEEPAGDTAAAAGAAEPVSVDALIERARAHPLGIDFLLHGHLGSVAAMFHTHAFTVEAARDRLK